MVIDTTPGGLDSPTPQQVPATESQDLQKVAEAIIRRTSKQGSLLPRELRQEVVAAGVDPARWKDVLKLAGPRLVHRKGRYYYVPPISPLRQQQERRHLEIHEAVHELVRKYKEAAALQERREADRITFCQSAIIETLDLQQHHRVLTRDISTSGIRLLGSRSLLGQKVRLTVPTPDGDAKVFHIRILWSCMVADELYENGGAFVELVREDEQG